MFFAAYCKINVMSVCGYIHCGQKHRPWRSEITFLAIQPRNGPTLSSSHSLQNIKYGNTRTLNYAKKYIDRRSNHCHDEHFERKRNWCMLERSQDVSPMLISQIDIRNLWPRKKETIEIDGAGTCGDCNIYIYIYIYISCSQEYWEGCCSCTKKKNKMTANLWTNDNFQDNTIILVKQVR